MSRFAVNSKVVYIGSLGLPVHGRVFKIVEDSTGVRYIIFTGYNFNHYGIPADKVFGSVADAWKAAQRLREDRRI